MEPVGQARRARTASRRSALQQGWAFTKEVSAAWPNTEGAICRQASQSIQGESTKKSPGTFSGTLLLGLAMTATLREEIPYPHSILAKSSAVTDHDWVAIGRFQSVRSG